MIPIATSARDLSLGVPLHELADGTIVRGRVGDDDIILLRADGGLFAVSARCTHYGAALADGIVVGDTIRCPLHHACFSLRSGEALRAPALDELPRWRVEELDGTAYVREKSDASVSTQRPAITSPESIVIVGAGAAGLAAADMLRREGYEGPLTLISAEADPPVDRPNLSKDYLAGEAPDDWMPLRPESFYSDRRIDLLLDSRVVSIDAAARHVQLEGGRQIAFGALLLATGADPVRLEVEGASPGQVHTLRTFADARAIVAKAANAKRAVVVGASFIGLEVAASLRERGIEVHVIGRESVPMERVLGAEAGRFVRALHEQHGVVFHFGTTLARLDGSTATLGDGTHIEADLIVMGVGVRPSLALAESAGLTLDRGVLVDKYLQTSAPHVFAAGDIARWPDAHSGENIRVEHWVVAQRQGQVAARNMLGRREAFDAVPFFWSQHYDVTIDYVGHAESWSSIEIDGSLDARDCRLRYLRDGVELAVVTIGRERESLDAERRRDSVGA